MVMRDIFAEPGEASMRTSLPNTLRMSEARSAAALRSGSGSRESMTMAVLESIDTCGYAASEIAWSSVQRSIAQ